MDRRTFIAASAFALSPLCAIAAPAQLNAAQRDKVERATAYLNGLSLAQGKFVQTNSRGSSSRGTLYLNRPGKARFEYDAPAQMTVVADGKYVSVYDRRLKTFDRYSQSQTPLALFLAKKVRLDFQVQINRFEDTPAGFRLTLTDAKGSTKGSLILDFSDDPLTLMGWSIVDARNIRTNVSLSNLEPVGSLDPALFVLTDPRRES